MTNFGTQFNRWWQRYVMSGDVTTLLITIIMLLMPALALADAEWPLTLTITVPVMVISVIFGYFLSVSRYNELYALIVSTIYGLVVVMFVAAIQQSVNPVRGMEDVLARTIQWVYDAATGGINQDALVFSLVVSILFWFFGYNAAWHMFRIDRVWRVIIPPGLILLVNMVVYAGDANLERYLLVFVFMALLLIVRSNLEAREYEWQINNVRFPKHVRTQFVSVGAGLAILALLIAFAIPSNTLQQRLQNFQQYLASDPVRQMSEFWNRLVEPIDSEGPSTADYYGGDSLNLGGAIKLGDQVIMTVDAPPNYRYYWQSRTFERYNDGRWSPSATRRVPDLNAPLTINQPPSTDLGRTQVQHSITMVTPSRLYHTIPHPLEIEGIGRIDLLRTNGDQDDPNSPMNVSVIRPTRVISAGDGYDAISAISVASANELRATTTDYPEWVVNPNTYAGGISGRVAGLARQVVDQAGAVTPYDRAKAIETYLRNSITYNESIPSPPPGVDTVEWFLFEIRQGYCTYYASAMISMLRSMGIPARMAAGFAEGEYDPTIGEYVVRERDAHTWVEVYFPGYGWVPFEPTSAQAPLDREGDLSSNPVQPPVGQAPTSEPTSTPTALPSPTAQATPTLPPDQPENTPENNQPTITPTPSPTPTATAVIVPTAQPPVQPPPPENPLMGFLMRAVGFALFFMLIIIVIVLLFLLIYWWWEWRGFGKMNPIVRAYARLERFIPLIGINPRENETPEERREEIVRYLPQAERPVSAITRLYIMARYGRSPDEGTAENARDIQIADNAWQETRQNILMKWLRRLIPFMKD